MGGWSGLDPRTARTRGWSLRPAIILGNVIAAGVLAFHPSDVRAFQAHGPAAPLPAGGVLMPAGGAEFEGMLVGLRGRPVIVNVWAPWCTPCRSEAPLLARAARDEGDVVILGVDSKDTVGSGQRFIGDLGLLGREDAPGDRDRLGGLTVTLLDVGHLDGTLVVPDQRGRMAPWARCSSVLASSSLL